MKLLKLILRLLMFWKSNRPKPKSALEKAKERQQESIKRLQEQAQRRLEERAKQTVNHVNQRREIKPQDDDYDITLIRRPAVQKDDDSSLNKFTYDFSYGSSNGGTVHNHSASCKQSSPSVESHDSCSSSDSDNSGSSDSSSSSD